MYTIGSLGGLGQWLSLDGRGPAPLERDQVFGEISWEISLWLFLGWSILMSQLSWDIKRWDREQPISISWNTNKWKLFFSGDLPSFPKWQLTSSTTMWLMEFESKLVPINLCKRVCSNCVNTHNHRQLQRSFGFYAWVLLGPWSSELLG